MPPTILVVGEAWSEEEVRTGEPFTGPAGRLFRSMLRDAGIEKAQCHFTHVFNFQPHNNKLDSLAGSKVEAIEDWPQLGSKLWVRKQFASELTRLHAEIEKLQPKVVIALGATALWALTKERGIKKHRGTPVLDYTHRFKIFPTYHPSAIFRQWKLRVIGVADLKKASVEAEFPEIRRPERFIHLKPTISDLWEFHQTYLLNEPFVSADIETKQGTITEIGFSNSTGSHAIVIPFYSRLSSSKSYWPSVETEFKAWKFVRFICETYPLVGQNFSYDLQYLWMKMGIPCTVISDDTMLLHHALQPELEKSLGFLGSLYTNEPAWKFMRSESDKFKKEE